MFGANANTLTRTPCTKYTHMRVYGERVQTCNIVRQRFERVAHGHSVLTSGSSSLTPLIRAYHAKKNDAPARNLISA